MQKSARGFTLVELLIVIAIIAILAVIGITVYGGVQKTARDARRRADIDSISKAWETNRYQVTPYYPALSAGWFSSVTIPKDPSTGSSYNYVSGGANETTAANTYNVCAALGDTNINNCTATSASCYCQANQQ